MPDEVTALFWLLASHAICDFALQSDAMAKGKNWNVRTEPPPGQRYRPVWFYWLTAHSGVHAAGVALATGSVVFGVIEWVLHWCIDYAKCDNRTNIHVDQALHVACKLGYVAALWYGAIPSGS